MQSKTVIKRSLSSLEHTEDENFFPAQCGSSLYNIQKQISTSMLLHRIKMVFFTVEGMFMYCLDVAIKADLKNCH